MRRALCATIDVMMLLMSATRMPAWHTALCGSSSSKRTSALNSAPRAYGSVSKASNAVVATAYIIVGQTGLAAKKRPIRNMIRRCPGSRK